MWMDATGGEDELGPTRAGGARGEECVEGTGGTCIGSEAGVFDIVMWGS